MAAMTSADVIYSQQSAVMSGPGRVRRVIRLVFPTGNNDYPAGGIPLDKVKLGCPRTVNSIRVLGRTPAAGDTNPVYEWNGDPTIPKLVAFEGGSVAVDTPLKEATFTGIGGISQIVTIEVDGY
jgi:hypothetical protein